MLGRLSDGRWRFSLQLVAQLLDAALVGVPDPGQLAAGRMPRCQPYRAPVGQPGHQQLPGECGDQFSSSCPASSSLASARKDGPPRSTHSAVRSRRPRGGAGVRGAAASGARCLASRRARSRAGRRRLGVQAEPHGLAGAVVRHAPGLGERADQLQAAAPAVALGVGPAQHHAGGVEVGHLDDHARAVRRLGVGGVPSGRARRCGGVVGILRSVPGPEAAGDLDPGARVQHGIGDQLAHQQHRVLGHPGADRVRPEDFGRGLPGEGWCGRKSVRPLVRAHFRAALSGQRTRARRSEGRAPMVQAPGQFGRNSATLGADISDRRGTAHKRRVYRSRATDREPAVYASPPKSRGVASCRALRELGPRAAPAMNAVLRDGDFTVRVGRHGRRRAGGNGRVRSTRSRGRNAHLATELQRVRREVVRHGRLDERLSASPGPGRVGGRRGRRPTSCSTPWWPRCPTPRACWTRWPSGDLTQRVDLHDGSRQLRGDLRRLAPRREPHGGPALAVHRRGDPGGPRGRHRRAGSAAGPRSGACPGTGAT